MEPPGLVPDRQRILAVLQALADPVRMEMVRRLRAAGSDQGCAALYDDLPKSTASYHFAALRASGLIRQYDTRGRRINHLCEIEIEQLAPGLLDSIFR